MALSVKTLLQSVNLVPAEGQWLKLNLFSPYTKRSTQKRAHVRAPAVLTFAEQKAACTNVSTYSVGAFYL